MESFLVLLYGVVFVAVIYYMMHLKSKPGPKEAVITVEDASKDTSTKDSVQDFAKASAKDLWPWSITKYSFWPQWFNKDGFGHPGHPNDFGSEGGYGYTGRQDPRWDCSFEGDGYGKSMLGGNFARSGMSGYTGREPHPHCTTQLPYNEFRKLYEGDKNENKDKKDNKDNKDNKTK